MANVTVGVYWAHVYRGSCIGSIYTHPSRVGGIQQLLSSYTYKYSTLGSTGSHSNACIPYQCPSLICLRRIVQATWNILKDHAPDWWLHLHFHTCAASITVQHQYIATKKIVRYFDAIAAQSNWRDAIARFCAMRVKAPLSTFSAKAPLTSRYCLALLVCISCDYVSCLAICYFALIIVMMVWWMLSVISYDLWVIRLRHWVIKNWQIFMFSIFVNK